MRGELLVADTVFRWLDLMSGVARADTTANFINDFIPMQCRSRRDVAVRIRTSGPSTPIGRKRTFLPEGPPGVWFLHNKTHTLGP